MILQNAYLLHAGSRDTGGGWEVFVRGLVETIAGSRIYWQARLAFHPGFRIP